MQPFRTHTGVAVPLLKDDINTDQVAPVQAMRDMKPDYKKLLFMRARAEDKDFVLNQPQFADPGILVTGQNSVPAPRARRRCGGCWQTTSG